MTIRIASTTAVRVRLAFVSLVTIYSFAYLVLLRQVHDKLVHQITLAYVYFLAIPCGREVLAVVVSELANIHLHANIVQRTPNLCNIEKRPLLRSLFY
jgi:hypothetical protein